MSGFLYSPWGHFQNELRVVFLPAVLAVAVLGLKAGDLTAQPQQVQPNPSAEPVCYETRHCYSPAAPKCIPAPTSLSAIDLSRPTSSPRNGWANTSRTNHCGFRRVLVFITWQCGPPPATFDCSAVTGQVGPPEPLVQP